MPQSIIIQVGQCGNQIGANFWSKLMQEYDVNKEVMDDYFLMPKKKSSDNIIEDIYSNYSPRCVLVDMEEKVINDCCQGKFSNFFGNHQKILDVSGSGNNWARGYIEYGSKHMSTVVDTVRKEAEHCDNLESFFFMYSIGGGTGSGLGSAILENISTEFSKKLKINISIFPSATDDVVISPYNALLANWKLSEFSSMIIPYENDIISNIVKEFESSKTFRFHKKTSSGESSTSKEHPFPGINDIISSTVCDVTGVLHYPGELPANAPVLVSNLIPNDRVKYTMPSSSPFIIVREDDSFAQVINNLFSNNHFLIDNPGWPFSKVLCATIFLRGKYSSNDLQPYVTRLCERINLRLDAGRSINMSVSDIPPFDRTMSTTLLANSSSVKPLLKKMDENFIKMFRKKVYLHHYTGINNDAENMMNQAANNLHNIIEEYESVEQNIGHFLQRYIVL